MTGIHLDCRYPCCQKTLINPLDGTIRSLLLELFPFLNKQILVALKQQGVMRDEYSKALNTHQKEVIVRVFLLCELQDILDGDKKEAALHN